MKRRAFFVALLLSSVPLCACARAAAPGTLRIYLARHGESVANAAKTLAGQTDAPLTERGRQQARELAKRVSGVRFEAVYSSTLSRSRETAEIASAGARVQALPELMERSAGRFEGRPNDDPEYLRRSRSDGDDLDGGESLQQVYERVRDTLDRIQRAHSSGTVLIVGHQGTNRMILRALLDLSPEQANAIVQDNDELYAIDVTEGQRPRLWKLIGEANLSDL